MSSIGIYRAVSEKKKVSNTLFKPYPTMRPPGNVPYIVDNLWEWKRPDEFPNRRFSAFASPTPELAIEAVGGNSNAYKVEFNGVIKKPDYVSLYVQIKFGILRIQNFTLNVKY